MLTILKETGETRKEKRKEGKKTFKCNKPKRNSRN